jgi:hypothetical protein
MTGFAFEFFESVLNVLCVSGNHFFMTFEAGHLGMFAFQPEPRPVMVEIDGFPVFEGMAAAAVGNPFFRKLVPMGVFVAAVASRR